MSHQVVRGYWIRKASGQMDAVKVRLHIPVELQLAFGGEAQQRHRRYGFGDGSHTKERVLRGNRGPGSQIRVTERIHDGITALPNKYEDAAWNSVSIGRLG